MIREKEIGQRMSQLAFAKKFGLTRSRAAKNQRTYPIQRTRDTHSLKHTLKFTALIPTHTHKHISQCEGEDALIIFLSLVSVLLEQRLKEKRGHKREHAVPPFAPDFTERK